VKLSYNKQGLKLSAVVLAPTSFVWKGEFDPNAYDNLPLKSLSLQLKIMERIHLPHTCGEATTPIPFSHDRLSH